MKYVFTFSAQASLRKISTVAIFWLLLGGVVTLQLWPDLPITAHQWAIFLVVFPPLYMAGEAYSAWLFDESRGWAISRKPFSILRITLALPLALAWLALAWWLLTLMNTNQ